MNNILSKKITHRLNNSLEVDSKEQNSKDVKELEVITLKTHKLEEQFVKNFITNGLNGLRAYKAIKPLASDKTAGVKATELLKRDRVRRRIEELLPSVERDSSIIHKALDSPSPKVISWSEKHKYLETSLKLKGYLEDKPQNDIKIGLVVER